MRIASLIDGIADDELAAGLWRDDLLTLGGRLRALYGNDVALDRAVGGYAVRCGEDIIVQVTCIEREDGKDDRSKLSTVRVACPIVALPADGAGLRQFALRENARLRLARLVYEQDALWIDYELPFFAACGKILTTAVAAVASSARSLQTELAAAAC